MDTISDLHPLTMEIKKYFADNPENDFLRCLGALRKIEGIEIYPEDPEDDMVIINFDEKNMAAAVMFGNNSAMIEYECDGYSFTIDFYFSNEVKSIKYLSNGYFLSTFNDYGEKGRETLFKDILSVMENITKKKMFLEYLPCKPRGNSTDKLLLTYIPSLEQSKEEKTKIKNALKNTYNRNKKGSEFLTKARVFISPNQTIAVSNGWKDKYSKNKKLKSMQL